MWYPFLTQILEKGTRIDCLWTGEKKLQDPIYLPDIEQFQSNSKKIKKSFYEALEAHFQVLKTDDDLIRPPYLLIPFSDQCSSLSSIFLRWQPSKATKGHLRVRLVDLTNHVSINSHETTLLPVAVRAKGGGMSLEKCNLSRNNSLTLST